MGSQRVQHLQVLTADHDVTALAAGLPSAWRFRVFSHNQRHGLRDGDKITVSDMLQVAKLIGP